MAKPNKPRVMKRGLQKNSMITVRLSPKYRFALDLIARTKRQTVSSVIEGLIRAEVGPVLTAIDGGPPPDKDISGYTRALASGSAEPGMLLAATWDPRESDRFVNIATYAPGLLTEDEELIWRLIKEAPSFWKGGEVQLEAIRTHWDSIVRAASKGAPSLKHLTTKET